VGLNYPKVLSAMQQAGIDRVYFLTAGGRHGDGGVAAASIDARFPATTLSEVSVSELSSESFWSQP
jgi:hypothetical protein